MPQAALIGIAGIIVLGVGAQLLAWRLGLPSILLLLIFGFVAGPITGFLDPDQLFGKELLLSLVSVSVALILYEGGLSLSLADLPKVGGVVRNLVSVGAVLTWAVGTVAAYLVFDLDLGLATLLGAVLVVTGPTVIGPLLRHIRPSGPVGPILMWEGIVIDPIGAMLAVLIFEAIGGGEGEAATAQFFAMAVVKTIVLAGGLGLLAAGLLTLLIYRYWIPDFLQSAVSLMLVVAVFAGANRLQPESGLLAVTVMGIALANQRLANVRHIVEFKENLRVLLISSLFILLAARLGPGDLTGIGAGGLLTVALLVLFGRPLAVFVSTLRSTLTRKERLFLAWMAPRGIVAAAVSSVFALRLEEMGYANARMLVPITFLVIIGTVAIYGLTSPLVAHRLGVADPNPQGVLLVGAHGWVRALASLLQAKGYRVLLVDSNRANIAAARMAGLPTYAGSILAEYAIAEMTLGGIGRILAVTPNDWVNALAVQRFTSVFGRARCYQLPPQEKPKRKQALHRHLQGRWLFAAGMTNAALEQRFATGATVKATPLSAEFEFAAFRSLYGEAAVPLFVITEAGRLNVITADQPPKPLPGQTLISLVQEPDRPDDGRS
ncbi:MAG: cation:proton antiporter [Phycisphaerae bacterium]